MIMRAYLRSTDHEVRIGYTLLSDLGQTGTIEAIDSSSIKINGQWRDPAWWGVDVREMSARELLNLMIVDYATARERGRDQNIAALLIHAASLTLDMDDERATEHVGDMIQEFYANQA